ncbi:MAG: HlyD family efflux transporter periplasmic adaptor subunit [Bacteroidota bacterium]
MKKVTGIFFGIAIIALGMVLFIVMKNHKEALPQAKKTDRTMISTSLIKTSSLPFIIEATGTLTAKNKIALYSEVEGVLQKTPTPFKAGNTFSPGQDLLRINSAEYKAQLQSNKSSLMNQIAAMLPDMEIEFPEASKKWESYLENFDVNGPLRPLPETASNAEKFFVTGQGITETYYTVKNQQERISKYYIKAPFKGIVTESNVTVGTLVRNGQKLGEFIEPSVFELQLAIPSTADKYIEVGKKVHLFSLDGLQEYTGKISRINGRIDQETQTVAVVIDVTGKQLKDGEYLKAKVFGERIRDVVKIDGNLLVENDYIYVVKDSTLRLQKVKPINYEGDSVLVAGLQNKMVLVDEIVANAYPGMKVTY